MAPKMDTKTKSKTKKSSSTSVKTGALQNVAKAEGGEPPPSASVAEQRELRQILQDLEKEKKLEERARNFSQLERDKIQSFWDVTKRELDNKRAELRIKDKDMEDLQDKHALELKVYRQKVKHLLYEHQNNISKLKADAECGLKHQQEQHFQQETEIHGDRRRLKQHIKEQELSSIELLKQFRVENAKSISKLRQEFEMQARQIQQKYEAQLKELTEAMELRFAADLREYEESKAVHIKTLMANHEKAYLEMRAYYNEITHANLDLIKALKDEISVMKRAEAKNEKLVHDVARENKLLTEPLSRAMQEAETLRQAMLKADHDKAALHSLTTRLAASEKRAKSLDWENELLRQRTTTLQQERDELQGRFNNAVLQIQQKSSLKAAILEKKLEALSGEISQRDCQLEIAMNPSLPTSKHSSMHLHKISGRLGSPTAAELSSYQIDKTSVQQERNQIESMARSSLESKPNQSVSKQNTALHGPLPDSHDGSVKEDILQVKNHNVKEGDLQAVGSDDVVSNEYYDTTPALVGLPVL